MDALYKEVMIEISGMHTGGWATEQVIHTKEDEKEEVKRRGRQEEDDKGPGANAVDR